MKSLFMKSSLFVFTVILLDVMGCGPREHEEHDYLDVNPSRVILENHAYAYDTICVSSNANWKVASNYREWLDVSPELGKYNGVIIVYALSSNNSTHERSCTIILECGEIQRKVVVTQKGK